MKWKRASISFAQICGNTSKLGFQQRYNEDQELALHLRMLCALAFLPPNDVVQMFEELVDLIRANYNNDVEDLLKYFEDTYISHYQRIAPRRILLFPIELWNMFNRTVEELPRTNNSVKDSHRRFQSHLMSCYSILQNES